MARTYIPITIEKIADASEQPSKTYKVDLESGRIIGMIDGEEAVQQAIWKSIMTPRYRFPIYTDQYGSEIEDAIIAKDGSRAYTENAIEGFVRDALKPDGRIKECGNFNVEFEEDKAYISFTAKTIFGNVDVEEVL